MENKIKQILATQFGVAVDSINNNMSIVDDLDADSVDHVEVVIELENIFDIEISSDEQKNAGTVDKIIALVAKKLSQK